ncbi:L,D-transpeptidase [Glycomyces buryatensis]|uniref:L,D-transpeptidase n=1 Tax=Glycomyces buryatensis TaxID=2570927 RepID=UPI0014562C5D|nr:Ig-like domain-containing protein [Glycomyces buryatensis]
MKRRTFVVASVTTLLPLGACAAPPQGSFTPAPIVPKISLDAGEEHDPTEPFTLAVTKGLFEEVSVTTDRSKTIEGSYNEDLTEWVYEGVLDAGSLHTVSAKAVSTDGTVTEFKQEFTTEGREGSGFGVADVTPVAEGETVGVGAPIIVTFTEGAPDRAEVEKNLKVESETEHEGAWRWMSDSQVIYRTKEYWGANQTVTFTASFGGVFLGGDTWGEEDHTAEMKIGASQISRAHIPDFHMEVEIDGEVAKTIPISAGNGEKYEYITASGTHLVMEKLEHKVMVAPGKEEDDPDYYETPVDWATRINASGEFVHGAPWSVGSQGNANVSHGCLNASNENAKWFFDIAQRGDPVEVTGTERPMPYDNGWGYWVMGWDEWKEGSAL